jgi:hypothetical protein
MIPLLLVLFLFGTFHSHGNCAVFDHNATIHSLGISHTTVVTDGVLHVSLTAKGHLNTTHHPSVALCHYSTSADFIIPSPYCYACALQENGEFGATVNASIQLNAMTIKYVVMIVDSSALFEEKMILAQQGVVVDILNSKDSTFFPVSGDLLRIYQRHLRLSVATTAPIVAKSALTYNQLLTGAIQHAPTKPHSMNIMIYFRSLVMSGSNTRLARFGCFVCDFEPSTAGVTFLVDHLGGARGPLMDELEGCKCPLLSIYLSGEEADADRYDPENLNMTFINHLHSTDFLIVPNSHGDLETNLLFHHVQLVRQQQQQLSQDSSLLVVLDLCNHYTFEEDFKTFWPQVVDGLISPSLYMTRHQYTRLSGKPVETVYPACSSSGGHSQSAAAANAAAATAAAAVLPWPRRRNGRFQVGHFGRLGPERSVGLFVRVVAHLLGSRAAAHVRSNFEFVVVGGGVQMSVLQELAQQLGVQDDVSFVGDVEDFGGFLCQADLVVNTIARGETFGIMQVIYFTYTGESQKSTWLKTAYMLWCAYTYACMY